MNGLEAACVAIVLCWVLIRGRGEAPAFYGRLAALATASFLGEDTCVRAYHFYGYSARWSLYLDVVPLLVVLIWPVVIHSAWDLARHLGARHVPLVAALLVLADASLIEPVSVRAGLWSWAVPGLFDVPPIGLVGWAFHAGLCTLALERGRPLLALLAPLGVHALLLVTWWGALRWMSAPLPPWPAVALAAATSLALAWHARCHRAPPRELFARVPAALFFFALLWMYGTDVPALVAWALCFAPPYVTLTVASLRASAGAVRD